MNRAQTKDSMKGVPAKPPRPKSKSSNINVVVRVRPFLSFEAGNQNCVEVLAKGDNGAFNSVRVDGKEKSTFTFDATYPSTSSQSDLFTSIVPLVDACLDGYNATVLAYGQTGSGKTHTILGECEKTSDGKANEEAGVIPRALKALFYRLDNFLADAASDPLVKNEYKVRVQFLELYGENIRDLLSEKNPNKSLAIRDGSGSSEPEVIGASEVEVLSADDALLCLTRGTLRRVTRATAMNSESSRSHAIMSVIIHQKTLVKGESSKESTTISKTSRFHFVDLAGSERAKRTGATGQGMKEGININKGLLVLGNVISALGDPRKRGKSHVPYRDSKLTRLLKGSLGGNHRTLMIACVSPSSSNSEETTNTLRYANRAKNIKNKAKANIDPGSKLVAELRQQIKALAGELLNVHEGMDSNGLTQQSMLNVPKDTLLKLARGKDMKTVSPEPCKGGKPIRSKVQGKRSVSTDLPEKFLQTEKIQNSSKERYETVVRSLGQHLQERKVMMLTLQNLQADLNALKAKKEKLSFEVQAKNVKIHTLEKDVMFNSTRDKFSVLDLMSSSKTFRYIEEKLNKRTVPTALSSVKSDHSFLWLKKQIAEEEEKRETKIQELAKLEKDYENFCEKMKRIVMERNEVEIVKAESKCPVADNVASSNQYRGIDFTGFERENQMFLSMTKCLSDSIKESDDFIRNLTVKRDKMTALPLPVPAIVVTSNEKDDDTVCSSIASSHFPDTSPSSSPPRWGRSKKNKIFNRLKGSQRNILKPLVFSKNRQIVIQEKEELDAMIQEMRLLDSKFLSLTELETEMKCFLDSKQKLITSMENETQLMKDYMQPTFYC